MCLLKYVFQKFELAVSLYMIHELIKYSARIFTHSRYEILY